MTMEFPVIVFGLCWLGKNEFVWNNKHNFLVKAAADVHSALQCTVDSWVCKVLIMGGSWEDHGRIMGGLRRDHQGSWKDHERITGGLRVDHGRIMGWALADHGAIMGGSWKDHGRIKRGPWEGRGGLVGPLGAPTTTTTTGAGEAKQGRLQGGHPHIQGSHQGSRLKSKDLDELEIFCKIRTLVTCPIHQK